MDYIQFKSSFKGDLVTPSDSGYDAAIARWLASSMRKAKIVAFVKDAADVALAIKYAVSEKLPLAIRGGGHSFSGASSSEGGLVIDLSRYVNEVTVDPSKKLAYVGGGALWATVDEKAIEHGLASVAGTVNHTGVGGLALGGGFGWLSAEHGLVVDNIAQVTIVVADGSVLVANDEENADLFWAVRGGGSNFGVCMEFVLKLHEQRKTVYAGMMIFPPPLLGAILKVTEEWWTKGPSSKEGMVQMMGRGPAPDFHPCIIVSPFYNGSEAEGREAFKAFLDLKPLMDMTREIPYEQLNAQMNEQATHGKYGYARAITQTNLRPDVFGAVFERFVELSSSGDMQFTILFEYLPFGKINSVSNTAMAFNNRGTHRQSLFAIQYAKESPELAKRAREAARELSNIVTAAEPSVEESTTRAYGNYVGDDIEHINDTGRAKQLFGENYPRLRQLKKKYDPDVIFSKWFKITPQ